MHFAAAPRLSAEGQVLYSIWKIRRGFPLYESPLAPPFAVSLYNFLSYDTYAAALALFRVPDAGTPAAARGVTAALAIAGATLMYFAARALPGARRPDRSIAVLLALLTWTGAVLPGGWTLAIRPDVGAATLDLAGIYVVLRVLRGSRRSGR